MAFCREFERTDGRLDSLHEIVPPWLVTELITWLHKSVTAAPLGSHETIEKIRQRFCLLVFETYVKHHFRKSEKCQKLSAPPQKHRDILVDWNISYPFHYFGLIFYHSLPTSNGCCYTLLIGDQVNWLLWSYSSPRSKSSYHKRSSFTTSD